MQLLSVTQELEERNTTLEQKFTNLVEKNNSLQDREKTLTADLDAATKYGGKDSRTTVYQIHFYTYYYNIAWFIGYLFIRIIAKLHGVVLNFA